VLLKLSFEMLMSGNGLYLQIPHQSTFVQPAVKGWKDRRLDK
jgi:hypothetical protein